MKKVKLFIVSVVALLCNFTQVYAENITFDDWTSSNHEDSSTSSETYTFTLTDSATISFDWSVSSEGDCDPLIVTLNGNEILRNGGNKYGIYTQALGAGEYTLTLNYTKDGSVSTGDDQAVVSNIIVGTVMSYSYTDENGVTWTYQGIEPTSSARIVKAEGYTTEVNVPATLTCGEQQYPVTMIAHSFANDENIVSVDLSKTSITATPSFQSCPSLTSVLLPATLKEIRGNSFSNCNNLQTINFSNATALERIGSQAFYYCQKLPSVDLSATKVTEIGTSAFVYCNNLSTVLFPSTLATIGESAFNGCNSLQSIDLSATALTELKSGVFCSCCNLYSVVLPATLKKIGNSTFNNNSNLTINLSEVEEIGDWAFQDTYLLVADLSSAKSIGSNAFTSSSTTFTINASTPATIKSNSFHEDAKFVVSPEAYDTFCATAIWSNWKDNISMYTIDSDNIKWIYRYLADSNGISITSASGYGTEVTVPGSLPYNGTNCSVTHLEAAFNGSSTLTAVTLPSTLKSIGNSAFNSTKITGITIPTSVESIGSYAFAYCQALENVTLPSSLITLANDAFRDCDKLEAVDLSNTAITVISDYLFYECYNLEEVKLPQSITEIEAYAFCNCHKLSTINIPASVRNIGNRAFRDCYDLKSIDLSKVETIGDYAFGSANLTSVDLSSATSIGSNAFTSEIFFSMDNVTPATIASGAFTESSMFLVPGAAVDTYKSADVWSDYAANIFGRDVAVQTINVTAQESGSGVLEAIGGSEYQTQIIDLTVKGTINGYDFVMFKDKMTNLRYLDLTDAEIVYNPYCYYEYNYSQNDTLGAYAFYQEDKLLSVKLPKNVKHIGGCAFYGCSSLKEMDLPDAVKSIGYGAFQYCHSLANVTLPNTTTSIGEWAFDNTNLKEIVLPNKLENIGEYAFRSNPLKEIVFPVTLTNIGYGAFQGCSRLETVRIPSSLQYIGDYAFQSCSNLKNVYAYTIEPMDINENTFSNFETATLYVPVASGQNYYWDEGWKRFVNVAEFDEEYEYFYLNGDHTLDESTGAIDGTPDADLNAGSGLTVEEGVEQNMADLNIQHNGTTAGSIIAGSAEGNVHTDSLHVNINVSSGRWYFFCFPFDLKKANLSMGKEGTQYIFRCYNGEKRAAGNSGWENVTEGTDGAYLQAGIGYIFQCSQSDVLTISLANVTFKREDKYNELVAHTASNLQDASWNFVGNPYLSYYDMNSVGYDAPITVWNGSSYEAIKPGDDDYHFAPFEAFFVQKPEGTSKMEFDGSHQTTHKGSQEQQASGARSVTRAINPDRLLVNITLSNGETTDRTRIVFNDKVSMGYELACDAAKFEVTDVPQLYTIDSRAVKYAINERPVAEGTVTLGYSVPVQGNYTLAAPRMDTPVYVKDNLTRIIHNFRDGNYEFSSEAGTFEGRFTILTRSGATGIEGVQLDELQEDVIYNLNGQRVNKATGKGIYIKNNRKEVNVR